LSDLLVFLALAGFGVLAGLVVALLGLRGRKINNHTFCRTCGVDVTDLPGDVVVCPGCKADLSQASAMRYGARRRDRRLVAAGLALAVLAAGISVYRVVSTPGVNWPKWSPTWLLVHRARGSDPQTSPTLVELMIRIKLKEVTDAKTHELVRRGLEQQADANQPWLADWGSLLESAQAAGKTEASQWLDYWRHGVSPKVRVRAAVRPGAVLPIEVALASPRLGAQAGRSICRMTLTTLSVDGVAWADDAQPIDLPLSADAAGAIHALAHAPKGVVLAPGGHVARAVVRVEVFHYPEDSETRPPGPWDSDCQAPFEVVAAGKAAGVALVDDPSLAQGVDKAVSAARQVEVTEEGGALTLLVKGNYFKLPIDVAGQVQIKWGTHPFTPVGFIALHRGVEGADAWSVTCPLPAGLDPSVKTVTVRLLPSEAAAESTVDMNRIWKNPIPLDDHYLFWPAQTQPASP
jgi:hypothetical protein